MSAPLRILALEPWLGGSSHAQFLAAWEARSAHAVRVLGLPDRHWKWRMRDGARALAGRAREAERPDVFFASDYLDVPTFYGFLPPDWASIPLVLYVHENQLTYPARPDRSRSERERDAHYGYTNVLSLLRADRVVFNSRYHREDFGRGARALLAALPDGAPRGAFERAFERSRVCGPGIELDRIPLGAGPDPDAPLRIVFNHRLEHDKDPVAFLRAVRAARALGLDACELVLLGERFEREPEGWADLRRELAPQIAVDGFAPSFEAYAAELGRADLAVSTARHEFYGQAAAEALAAGCEPLFPDRLAYPELLGPGGSRGLYRDDAELAQRMADAPRRLSEIRDPAARRRWRGLAERLDAAHTARELDRVCEECSEGSEATGELV